MRTWTVPAGRLAALSLLLGTILVALPQPASAAIIAVTTTADDYNVNVGTCSLREAITAANTDAAFGGCPAGSGADTINLQAQTYTLDELGANENANVTGDLDIVGDATINGPSTGLATIDANDIDRVFEQHTDDVFMNRLIVEDGNADQGGGILGGAGAQHLTFATGIIQNNTATDSGGGSDVRRATFVDSTIQDNTAGVLGGGLRGHGELTLIRTSVDGNDVTADTGRGGGIYSTGNLTLMRSAVTFNTTQGRGGGISSINLDPTTVTLTRTRVSNNSAHDGGGGLLIEEVAGVTRPVDIVDSAITDNVADGDGIGVGDGGGILNGERVSLSVSRTTLSGNTAADGGGIFNAGGATLTNATISGNRSDDQGGGIFSATGSDATLDSVTFDNNAAANGGHIYQIMSVTVTNTLMGPDGGGGHCVGSQPTSIAPNMEAEDVDYCFEPPNLVADVRIGPLQNNGGPGLLGGVGPPRTHALLAGSPAIDAGSDGPPTDQRGVPRPQGAAPDLGAYERAFCQGVLVNRVGTEGDDSITGSTEVDGVLALGGDDLVHGLEGDDHICGGAGNDELWGGDPFTVGDGRDLLLGAGGNDTLRGGDAADDLRGGGGGDQLLGGAGADDASGGAGADSVVGNAGNDDLFGNDGPDKLAGGPDKDACNGGPGTDSSTGCESKTGIP